jgi:GNAT superfamily N-acetyltransferase
MEQRVQEGIRLFNAREFFVCHEVLEEVWTPEQGPRRLFLQSLIHVAVGFYHHSRGNPAGAIRQLRKALRKLSGYLPACEGIDTARLYAEAQAVLQKIEMGSEVSEYPRIQSSLQIDPVDPTHPEAAGLIAALDRELLHRYPDLEIHGIDADGFIERGGLFLIGRIEGEAVACGAIRPLDGDTAELKRMFVRPEHRSRGLARALLAALEAAARDLGYRVMRLETGEQQPEAIALYRGAGYLPIPRYGEFIDDPRSRCFQKTLSEKTL